MGFGRGRSRPPPQEKQVKNNYNETNISQYAQHKELLSSAHGHRCVTSLVRRKHFTLSKLATSELHFDLSDNDSYIDMFD